MAELKFKLLASLDKLKKDLSNLLSKKHKLNVDTSGVFKDVGIPDVKPKKGDVKKEKQDKKSNSLLVGIAKKLLPLAVLFNLKNISDLMKVLVNFTILAFFKIFRSFPTLVDKTVELVRVFREKIKQLAVFMKLLPGKIGVFLKELPAKIWGFLKELPAKIWSFLKGAFSKSREILAKWFTIAVDWLRNMASLIWEKLKEGFNWIVEQATNIWNTLVEWFTTTVDWLKDIWDLIKEKAVQLFEKIKTMAKDIWEKVKPGFQLVKDKVQGVIDWLKKLPGLIWDKMKGLGSIISGAVSKLIPKFPFSKKRVDDAIIKPGGQIIETNPKDTIIATQNPNALAPSNKTFIFNGVTSDEMLDIIKRELGQGVLVSSRF